MSEPGKTSDSATAAAGDKALPLSLLVVFGASAGLLQVSSARSRESLLPAMRVLEQQEKGVDRAVGAALPLTPEQERAYGERFDNGIPRDMNAQHQPLQGLVQELGPETQRSPLVTRLRDRYRFRVVDSAALNAFAVPGGFVYVTSSLAQRLSGHDDQLLFVLAHEVGHEELGHCADGIRLKAYGDALGAGLAGEAASLLRAVAAQSFSKSQELEADVFAARLLASIGRDPGAGLAAFETLGLRDGDDQRGDLARTPGRPVEEALTDYFRTHPGSWERRERLRAQVARLRAEAGPPASDAGQAPGRPIGQR